jgi:hypothetical protein
MVKLEAKSDELGAWIECSSVAEDAKRIPSAALGVAPLR